TQERFADRVGCAMSTIEKIERGLRRPSQQVAERLAEILGLPDEERATFVRWARGVSETGPPSLPVRPITRKVESAAPAGHTAQFPPSSLPASVTSFVGREREVARVRSLLWRADVRLLTLTGPPGIGKTRLGLTVAASLGGEFEHGVWFVPLAPLFDPDLVPATIAKTLGLKESTGEPADAKLQTYLQHKQLLLVLDNFEQVVEAAPTISGLLAVAPRLKVLVTSRAALHIYGEHEFAVPPLALPDLSEDISVDALSEYASVALFVERAQAANPDFELTPDNAQAVAEICARLEGLPLAIELAAARIKTFSPHAMLERLGHRLSLLVGGPLDRTPRQRTLRGAIEWSYSLLGQSETRLFRRLSVFVGGCTLEAAEAVCDVEGATDHDTPEVLESLANKSLLTYVTVDAEPRFSMLETIREYGREQLQESGEADSIQQQHARYFLSLAERAEPELRGRGQGVWMQKLEIEHDNMRAALAWTLDNDIVTALKLCAALWRFWWMRGFSKQGYDWVERAVGIARGQRDSIPGQVFGAAVHAYATLAHELGRFAEAETLYNESRDIQREVGDRRGLAVTLCNYGSLMWQRGQYGPAESLFQESFALYKMLEDRWGMSVVLTNLGVVASARQDYPTARAFQTQNLAIKREIGDEAGLATTLNNLGVLAHYVGDLEEARQRFSESLEIRRRIGERPNTGVSLLNLGAVMCDLGDYATSRDLLRESLQMRHQMGDISGMCYALEEYACLAVELEQATEAVQIFGAVRTLRERLGAPGSPSERVRFNTKLAKAREQLHEEAFATAWHEGTAMSVDEVVALALEHVGPDSS
ncbi:MAG: tetratricopeptide repeat protein, partial [Chloroflexota bacterium]|nr:tetratricopeptide repeat protein [Chloroflexota bacterium]